MFNESSFAILRTNPKLTTNVKLVVTSDDNIFMSSFEDINAVISSSVYKKYKVSSNSLYNYDLFNFWKKGLTPSQYIFDVKPTDVYNVKNDFKDQFEEIYSYGCQINKNPSFKEEYRFFAPLWLNKELPQKFIILRLDEPILDTIGNDLLNKSTIIKTFDLINSEIGKYLQNYISQKDFPKGSVRVDYDEDEFLKYAGISLERGGFSESSQLVKDIFSKDKALIEFEEFITTGFERKNLAIANLLNLEFLFDDNLSTDYTINRYVGLYVNEFEDGVLDIIGIQELSNNQFLLQSEQDTYDQSVVVNQNSLFYIKSSKNNLFTVKKSESFNNNELIIKGDNTILSELDSFSDVQFSASAKIIKRIGRQFATIQILGEPINNSFYSIGLNNVSHTIYATNTLPKSTYSYNYFSSLGTPIEIAFAMNSAINNISDDNLFAILQTNNTILIYSQNERETKYQKIYTSQTVFDPNIILEENGVFKENFRTTNNKVAISIDYKDFLKNTKNLYVKTLTGYSKIKNIYSYLEEPIFNNFNEIINFKNLNSFIIIELDDEPYYDNNNKIQFFQRYQPQHGRLSILPVKDFDFDFFSDEYAYNLWKKFYNIFYFNNLNTNSISQTETFVANNNTSYPDKIIEYKDKFNYFEIIDVLLKVHENERNGNNNSIILDACVLLLSSTSVEFYQYMYDTFGFIIEFSYDIQQSPYQITFLKEQFFQSLINLLDKDDIDGNISNDLKNEYERLNENNTTIFSVVSRLIPYINKWVLKDKNVKELPYRLNSDLSFGTENFSPSFFIKRPTPQFFTHEWYYLNQYPKDINGTMTNFINNVKINDPNLETIDFSKIQPFFNTAFDIQRYLNNANDYFNQFFTVEKVPYTENGQTKFKFVTPQFRFSTFERKSNEEFAETFFRGVKLLIKNIKQRNEINNNLNSLPYIKTDDFSGYKFSAILVPIYYEYDVTYSGTTVQSIEIKNKVFEYENIEYKIYNDVKNKNILFFIQVKIPYISNIQSKKIDLDHNTLYNLKSLIGFDGSNITYLPTPLSGALDLSVQEGPNTYRGLENNLGSQPLFTDEIFRNSNGVFEGGIIVIQPNDLGPDILRYTIPGILTVQSNTLVQISGSINVVVPPLELSDEFYKRTALFLEKGGKLYFENLFQGVSFANIYELVNTGSPLIQYFTINEDNTITKGPTDFILEFERPNNLQRQNTLSSSPDNNKPNSLLLLNSIIGYNILDDNSNKKVNINRYKGWYQPKFNDIFQFSDVGLPESEKDINLQFDFNQKFGIIKNYVFAKTNIETSNNILSVNNVTFKAVYPLVNETALDKRDFNTFLTNWDNNYYLKSENKNTTVPTSGFFNHIESKTFFGSKAVTVPESFVIESFNANQYNLQITQTGFNLNLNIQDRLIEILRLDGIKQLFDQYTDYSNIKERTKEDFLNNYILENLLPRYYISEILLLKLSSDRELNLNYFDFNATDVQKRDRGYTVFNNYTLNYVQNSRFNVEIINNISNSLQRYNYYAITVKIAKNKYK